MDYFLRKHFNKCLHDVCKTRKWDAGQRGSNGSNSARIRYLVIGLVGWFVWLFLFHFAQAQSQDVLLLEIEGPVTPAMVSYFARGIETAESQNLPLLIVLDTPGGGLDPLLEIVQTFRAAQTPVIVFIAPRGAQAASAGAIITMAAHLAAMAPETVIGAASPVSGEGADLDETLFLKLTEDMKAQVRSLTAWRGETAVALAEAMIEEARAVHAEEALAAGLIDVVAEDVPALLRQIDGRVVLVNGQEVVLATAESQPRPFRMSFIEQLLHLLTNPVVVSILLFIGAQAILIEISSPGGWVAGFIGVLSLAIALYGLGQLPVNWLGLGLIGVAFVLFVLEIKAPTHGALAFTGTATLIAGLLVLFNSPGTPDFARISLPAAVAIGLTTAAFFIFILTMALRARRAPVITGAEGLVGRVGLVRTPLTLEGGMVLVNGELWRAEADEPLEKGVEVVITAVRGFTLAVKRKS